MIMQILWGENLGWDESLPNNIHTEWLHYYQSLTILNDLKISRHVLCHNYTSVELHGFSDASSKAYGACIYARYINPQGNIFCSLLCSKSKVAPLKTMTIPRLELCGAHLLSRLYHSVLESLNLSIFSVTLWCDSTIVLAWLRQCPSTLRTFIANRVAQIKNITASCEWRHVPTNDNPADLISRGIATSQLIDSKIWWHGPQWLSTSKGDWPTLDCSIHVDDTAVECRAELRPHTEFSFISTEQLSPILNINNFSSLSKLERVTAYIFRFIYNAKHPSHNRRTGFLTHEERKDALLYLIQTQQKSAFCKDLANLSKGLPIASISNIKSLAPFLDNANILRVGGRLKHSNINYDQKHPILLPGSNHLTNLLFKHEHVRLLHVGPLGLLNSIRSSYWPLSGRNTARKTVHDCLVCFRAKPRSENPEMGNLPVTRINPSPPFYHCGVDYAGPYTLKNIQGRGCKTYKGYIAVFVCMSTKALHLESVTDLTAQAFLATLRRFVARRGKPATIFSDNGTNFIGANRKLNELGKFLKQSANELEPRMDAEGVSWKFIPARSPHFGGLWEAGVKAVKYHLRRIVGEQIMTYEDFSTLLAQIESILNSRPLSPLSCDPNDFSALTPAHFLVGRSLTALPDKTHTDANISSISRYQRLQLMTQTFWDRWAKEYLNTLQQRSKWRRSSDPNRFATGKLVLLMDENAPPLQWKLGRIVAAHPGDDGITRVVTVRTTNGTLKRAVHKLCPLPTSD